MVRWRFHLAQAQDLCVRVDVTRACSVCYTTSSETSTSTVLHAFLHLSKRRTRPASDLTIHRFLPLPLYIIMPSFSAIKPLQPHLVSTLALSPDVGVAGVVLELGG